jgi:hypothetical protein
VDASDFVTLALLGGPRGTVFDFDWKEGPTLIRRVRKAVKERGFIGQIRAYRGGADIEVWLKEMNHRIGVKGTFADGTTYELLDLEQGNDLFCLLLCRKGYRIPKRALYVPERYDQSDTV